MEKFHFTRNRIAHHEPIHRRDLNLEHEYLLETVGWMCADSRSWIKDTSRTPSVLAGTTDAGGVSEMINREKWGLGSELVGTVR